MVLKVNKMFDGPSKISVRAAVAELFGTAGYVFVGAGAAASSLMLTHTEGTVDEYTLNPGQTGSVHAVAAAFGFAMAAFTAASTHVCGGQLNPAISVAFFLCSHISFFQCMTNIFFQCVGGAFGAILLKGAVDQTGLDLTAHIGANMLAPGLSEGHGALAEAAGTFFLCFVAIECWCNHTNAIAKQVYPIAIGLVTYALHVLMIPLTMGGLNPARSTATALVANFHTNELYIWWLGPLAGAVTIGIIGRFVLLGHIADDEAKLEASEDLKAIEMATANANDELEAGGLDDIRLTLKSLASDVAALRQGAVSTV